MENKSENSNAGKVLSGEQGQKEEAGLLEKAQFYISDLTKVDIKHDSEEVQNIIYYLADIGNLLDQPEIVQSTLELKVSCECCDANKFRKNIKKLSQSIDKLRISLS